MGAIALWILSVYIILRRIVRQCPQSAIGHWPGRNTLISLCPSDKAVRKTSAVGVLTERGTFKQRKFSPSNRLRLDRTLAWAQYSYIIVSVRQGCSEDLRSWSLDGEGNFQAEKILAVEPTQIRSDIGLGAILLYHCVRPTRLFGRPPQLES